MSRPSVEDSRAEAVIDLLTEIRDILKATAGVQAHWRVECRDCSYLEEFWQRDTAVMAIAEHQDATREAGMAHFPGVTPVTFPART